MTFSSLVPEKGSKDVTLSRMKTLLILIAFMTTYSHAGSVKFTTNGFLATRTVYFVKSPALADKVVFFSDKATLATMGASCVLYRTKSNFATEVWMEVKSPLLADWQVYVTDKQTLAALHHCF